MNDVEFLQAFENGTLSPFRHVDHLRLAWLYLSQHGWDEGIQRIRSGIQQFAAAHGASGKYHETITLFWARLVHQAMTAETDFDALIAQHPQLLDIRLMNRHYSPERLAAGRNRWLEPDLLPVDVQT